MNDDFEMDKDFVPEVLDFLCFKEAKEPDILIKTDSLLKSIDNSIEDGDSVEDFKEKLIDHLNQFQDHLLGIGPDGEIL